TFDLTYGTNRNHANSFGMCASATAKAQAANELSAGSSCQTEQADASFAASHSGKTFAQVYGTTAFGANAFGKCVSSKANATSNAQTSATVSAAKACKSEYDLGIEVFLKK